MSYKELRVILVSALHPHLVIPGYTNTCVLLFSKKIMEYDYKKMNLIFHMMKYIFQQETTYN